MRLSVLLLSFLISGQAGALGSSLYPDLMEFDEALRLYQAGDLERARRGFRHLAELGDPEAQLNLGVMLVKGEGGDSDALTGTAWVQLAAESGVTAAQEVLEIMAARLDEAARAQVAAALVGLRDANSPPGAPEYAMTSRMSCVAEKAHRPPPSYPQNALWEGRIGFTMLHFLVSPEGNFDAIHAYPDIRRDNPFGPHARDAARRWNAHDCRAQRYTHAYHSVVFELENSSGERTISRSRQEWAENILAEARAGRAEQAYIVGMLGDVYDGLFNITRDERFSLLHQAAVTGFPDARYEYAVALPSGANEERWVLLAARQGYAPALFWLRSWRDLPLEERQQGLFLAAEAGFLPAVLLAVRQLAAHPDAAERDGPRALQLISGVPNRIRRGDPSMAEAYAMALAENGRFTDAISWQKRAVSTGRRLGRDTTGAAVRLASYEAGEPWRDSLLSSFPDAEDDD